MFNTQNGFKLVAEDNMNKNELMNSAHEILKMNDLGGYTVPTHGLYPFQWNWDAAITALGWMKFDEERAWQELHYLVKGQWENGMIPHIIFHENVDSYFPNATVWGVEREVATTAISQPPVLVSVIKIMLEQAKDQDSAQQHIAQLMPSLIAYHQWWYNERDPENTGLVVSYHPWESGMDNSPAWDESLANVPAVSWDYQRKDTQHIDADERPHKFEYDRFLYLVDFYKKSKFDSDIIYQNCPYKMHDVGIISILHKATKDLISLTRFTGGFEQAATELEHNLSLTEQAFSSLWSDEVGSHLNKDAITGKFSEVLTTGTLMALYGGLVTSEQLPKVEALLSDWLQVTPYGISSTYGKCEQYEPQRYWRGPVWLHINWLLALGVADYGLTELEQKIKEASNKLIVEQGYFEYFDSETGKGCGGGHFSWTAATALHWLLNE